MAYAKAECGCGCDGAGDGGDYQGLGWAAQAAALALEVGSQIAGGKDRHAGAFCCSTDHARGPWPAGFDPAGTYPRNAGVDGAPPDYRAREDPWLRPSRHGFSRLKDDYCNCFPIPHNGRWWVLGEVRDGRVFVGPPEDIESGLFVEIDENGTPISVPGFGDITAPEGGASGGGGAGGAPADGGGLWEPPMDFSGPEDEMGSGGFDPDTPASDQTPPPPGDEWTDALRSPVALAGVALAAALLIRRL